VVAWLAALLGAGAVAAEPAPRSGDPAALVRAVNEMAPAVERLAARTKPVEWPLLRACLYYALAGQRLLAARGIPTVLNRGRLIYAPGTPACHPIHPHVWLESPGHLIDFSTLPRWGRPTVLSLSRTALPGSALSEPPLAVRLPQPCDAECLEGFLRHRQRFLSRAAEPPIPRAMTPGEGAERNGND
jgi:hypothetical protein